MTHSTLLDAIHHALNKKARTPIEQAFHIHIEVVEFVVMLVLEHYPDDPAIDSLIELVERLK
jgi:hypothetical protein